MPTVVVIGAGAAGLGAALELVRRGYKVILLEQATLGSGASGRNPGRMGHGFHYVDKETATMYLRASVEVQRSHPNYLVGKTLQFDHPLRHGRYFITKDSDNRPEEILETYKHITDEYAKLIAEDSRNEVFGPPEKFFRILDPDEYEELVNPDLVEMGVETAEHLFDWQAFAKDMKAEILSNENIKLCEHTEVTQIERGELHEARFTLHLKNNAGVAAGTTSLLHADYIVNSAWQNIERLNDTMGLPMIPGARTNRLKSLLLVKLPESLVNANSMFFCMGQHCMFSNMGNGYGMMTFGNVTNMEASVGLNLSDFANRLLDGNATDIEKEHISRTMLEGVSKYIPQMINATIIDVKFGIVQTAGTLLLDDLKNPHSNFHKRNYDGIREEQIGLVSNPCMKLFYFVKNGINVADWVDAQCIATPLIQKAMQQIEVQADKYGIILNSDLKKSILGNMERHTTSTAATRSYIQSMSDTLFQAIQAKARVTAELQESMLTTPPNIFFANNFFTSLSSRRKSLVVTSDVSTLAKNYE